jgi:hypothetical protein
MHTFVKVSLALLVVSFVLLEAAQNDGVNNTIEEVSLNITLTIFSLDSVNFFFKFSRQELSRRG